MRLGYLHEQGFRAVYALDISEKPLAGFQERHPDFPKDQLLVSDFFELEQSEFDLILEQTFFCALLPKDRERYVQKMHQLLSGRGNFSRTLIRFSANGKRPAFWG